jgi:hypothetical protein
MRSVVGDDTLEDLWMHESAIEERAVFYTHRGGTRYSNRAATCLQYTMSCDNPNTDKDALMMRK